MDAKNVKPIDSFNDVFKILFVTGFFIHKEPKTRCRKIGYETYRVAVMIILLLHNLIHLIFIIQNPHDTDVLFDTLIIEVPQINLFVKALTFYLRESKIRKLNKLLMDPIFAINSDEDGKILLESKKLTDRLWRFIIINCMLTSPMWVAIMFLKRYYDRTAIIYVYTPFEVNSWGSYSWSVFLEACPLFWMGCGHLTLDCAVVMYFSQVEVQLKIIKKNIEHLFDSDRPANQMSQSGRHRYSDEIDEEITKRFLHYVKRYEILLWFSREVNSIFNIPISIQFLTSMIATCAITYILSTITLLSLKCLFLTLFLLLVLIQVFICCYFGNLVQFESQSVASAVYLSDWQSASPRFRRVLLIAMVCWSRPLTLTVSGIIPLSLDTFVTFLKSAYTLYAVNGSIVDSKQQ